MDGWIKLHRKLLDSNVWRISTNEQKVILITLLLMANHSDKEWIWQGKKFTCKPGQFVTSLQSIADLSGDSITIKNVRTALTRFEQCGFLANESAKTGRLITIVNWSIYQCSDDKSGKETGKGVAKKLANKPAKLKGHEKPVKQILFNKNKSKDGKETGKETGTYQEVLISFKKDISTEQEKNSISAFSLMETQNEFEKEESSAHECATDDDGYFIPQRGVHY